MPVPQTFQSGQAAITRIICQQCQQKKEGQWKWQHSWGWDSASCWPRQGRVWTAKVWTISLLVAFVTSHAAFFSDQHLFGEGQRQRLERWVTGCPGEKTMEKAHAHCLIFFYRTRVRSLAMLVTHWLTNWLTDSLLFSELDWCDPGVWRCQLKTCWGCYYCCCWCLEMVWR